jgi:hypothetical protein
MWEFTDIRERAIQELSKEDMGMGAIDKIGCGKSYEVKEMLLDGYVELLKRTGTITDEEAERLGWKTAAKLLLLREEYLSTVTPNVMSQECGRCGLKCGGDLYMSCGSGYGGHTQVMITPPDRKKHDFTDALRKEFGSEL